jgi:hypothetical protein
LTGGAAARTGRVVDIPQIARIALVDLDGDLLPADVIPERDDAAGRDADERWHVLSGQNNGIVRAIERAAGGVAGPRRKRERQHRHCDGDGERPARPLWRDHPEGPFRRG